MATNSQPQPVQSDANQQEHMDFFKSTLLAIQERIGELVVRVENLEKNWTQCLSQHNIPYQIGSSFSGNDHMDALIHQVVQKLDDMKMRYEHEAQFQDEELLLPKETISKHSKVHSGSTTQKFQEDHASIQDQAQLLVQEDYECDEQLKEEEVQLLHEENQSIKTKSMEQLVSHQLPDFNQNKLKITDMTQQSLLLFLKPEIGELFLTATTKLFAEGTQIRRIMSQPKVGLLKLWLRNQYIFLQIHGWDGLWIFNPPFQFYWKKFKKEGLNIRALTVKAKEPSWKIGFFFAIKEVAKPLPKVQINEHDDLMDVDSLLTKDDLTNLQLFVGDGEVGSTGKAYKNCTCGWAEKEEKRKKNLRILVAEGNIRRLVFAMVTIRKEFDVVVLRKHMSAIRGEGQNGGLVQIQSNVLVALEAIDMDVATKVIKAGSIIGNRINRLMVGFSGAWCVKFDTSIPAVVRELPITRVNSRMTLQQILEGAASDAIILKGNNVVDFGDVGTMVAVVLDIGMHFEGDILVGVDGIWSKFQRNLFGQKATTYAIYICYTSITVSIHEWTHDTLGGIFHMGVRCVGCGIYLILGPRFQSQVKEYYDLCSLCFVEMGENDDYDHIDMPIFYKTAKFLKGYEQNPWAISIIFFPTTVKDIAIDVKLDIAVDFIASSFPVVTFHIGGWHPH